ncbi:MAG: hypothetical protein AB8G26_03830 [Ilumatobacter sp.]
MTSGERGDESADRLDELADTAELMGDEPTAARLRERAHRARLDELGRNDAS